LAVQAYSIELDCHKCPEGLQNIRGCYEEVEASEFEFEGEVLKRCPLKLVTHISKRFLRFYRFMEKGFLPNPGGILDQPNRFIEAMSIIDDSIIKYTEEERKDREDRQRHMAVGRRR